MNKPICFLERAGCAGGGKGILCSEEKTFTLSTVDVMRVCMKEIKNAKSIEMGALIRGQGERVWDEVCPTLRAEMGDNQPMAMYQSQKSNTIVRRLTPVECERLQGFPDNWTNIPWGGKETSPDGRRYKACGNSMAVPVMGWIGRQFENSKPVVRDEDAIRNAMIKPLTEKEKDVGQMLLF